jgi:hypothetical protein
MGNQITEGSGVFTNLNAQKRNYFRLLNWAGIGIIRRKRAVSIGM